MLDLIGLNQFLAQSGSICANRVAWFDETSSTNDVIMDLVDFHGAVCIAGLQTAGRGRRGGNWQAPFGSSVLLSMGWRIGQPQAAPLSLVCGLAVHKALFALGVSGALLKWPNDVLLNNHKIAGILLELNGDKCVIGLGLNVNIAGVGSVDQNQIPTATALPWSDLWQQGYQIDYNLLVRKLIVKLGAALTEFDRSGFAPLIDAWNLAHAYHGKQVAIIGRQRVDGRVLGVAESGAIVLQTANGARVFYCGDVSLRPLHHTTAGFLTNR